MRRWVLFFAILATLIAAVYVMTDYQGLRNERDKAVEKQHAKIIADLPTSLPSSKTQDSPRRSFKEGQAFARITVPAINADWASVEGVSDNSLDKGVGHYSFSARPGEIGNTAFACHRIRSLCLEVDKLKTGDKIIVQYEGKKYTYAIYDQYIVLPSQVGVVHAVPNRLGQTPTQRVLTLTTCLRNNEGGNQKRYIIHARLV